MQSWFASVQRELWQRRAARRRLRRQPRRRHAAVRQSQPGGAEQRAPARCRCRRGGRSPSSRDITYSFNGGKSRYHAFQTKFDWRIGAGLTLLNSLTLSQTKDNGAGSLENPNGNFPAPQDFNNLDADYRISAVSPAVQQHDQLRDRAAVRPRPQLHEQRVARSSTRCSAAGSSPASTPCCAGRAVTLTYTPPRRIAGVGHPAGFPRRQQLPAERQRRCAGAERPANINNWFNRDDGDRCRPIRASRSATPSATPCAGRWSGRSDMARRSGSRCRGGTAPSSSAASSSTC